MNNSRENLLNLQPATESMSALKNAVKGMSAVRISPEITESFQLAQKFVSSPEYQAMAKQQKILSEMTIPASLMAAMQAANNLIQPALQNINFDNLTKIVQSENFF